MVWEFSTSVQWEVFFNIWPFFWENRILQVVKHRIRNRTKTNWHIFKLIRTIFTVSNHFSISIDQGSWVDSQGGEFFVGFKIHNELQIFGRIRRNIHNNVFRVVESFWFSTHTGLNDTDVVNTSERFVRWTSTLTSAFSFIKSTETIWTLKWSW